jgi:hypothetical protein
MLVKRTHYLSGALAVLILVAPSLASSRKDSTGFNPAQPTTIGNTQLQPGQYTLEATEGQNQLKVLRDGKVIATVPCHWVQLPAKPDSSEVLSDSNNQVTEIRFQGRPEAVRIG